jgi:hypothetical protein
MGVSRGAINIKKKNEEKKTVAAGLSNLPVARSHIAVESVGLPLLHMVCVGVGQLGIPRTYMQWWAKLLRLLTVNSLSYFVKIKY